MVGPVRAEYIPVGVSRLDVWWGPVRAEYIPVGVSRLDVWGGLLESSTYLWV